MKTLLEIQQLSKVYRRGRKDHVEALHQVSFLVKEGSCVGLVGESGCGKSTLCRMVTGLEMPDEGRVYYKGIPVGRKENRGKIQMVFQNSLDAVNLHKDTFHILSEPMVNFFHMNREQRQKEAGRLLELVGLSEEDLWKYPQQFSGGQLQRVCIARALAAKPELLILDEPLSSLDVSVQAQVLNFLADIKSSMSLTYLLVSHDLKAVYYLSDALVVLYAGSVVERIDNMEDFGALCHPYTRRLLAAHGITGGEAAPLTEGTEQKTGCPYASRCERRKDICVRERPVLKAVSEVKNGQATHWVACHCL